MLDLNVANFITVGLIAIVSTIAVKWGLGVVGISPSWL